MNKLEVEWGTGYFLGFKVYPPKIFMNYEGKKVVLQWESPSDSTLIKQSRWISSVVGQMKLQYLMKCIGRNMAWLHHFYDIPWIKE